MSRTKEGSAHSCSVHSSRGCPSPPSHPHKCSPQPVPRGHFPHRGPITFRACSHCLLLPTQDLNFLTAGTSASSPWTQDAAVPVCGRCLINGEWHLPCLDLGRQSLEGVGSEGQSPTQSRDAMIRAQGGQSTLQPREPGRWLRTWRTVLVFLRVRGHGARVRGRRVPSECRRVSASLGQAVVLSVWVCRPQLSARVSFRGLLEGRCLPPS